jgi:hypothetical protein
MIGHKYLWFFIRIFSAPIISTLVLARARSILAQILASLWLMFSSGVIKAKAII